jgi:hypothetical protein
VTRKLLLGFAVLLVVAAAAYFQLRHASTPLEIAYAANRQVTLQSTTAQVREPITTVSYGDRLEVLQRFQDQVKVRTTTGLTGWVNERDLLSTDVWQKAADLGKKTSSLPVQARGHTRALTNLRIDAGRDGIRLRQLNKNIPLQIFERRAVEVPTSGAPAASEEQASDPAQARLVAGASADLGKGFSLRMDSRPFYRPRCAATAARLRKLRGNADRVVVGVE